MAYSKKDLEMFVWDKIWSGHDFNRIAGIAARMGYTNDMKLLKDIYDRLYSEYMEMYGEKMKDYEKNGLTETKRITMSRLKKIIAESIMKALSEEPDIDEFVWNNGYDAYVLVDDSDDSIRGNYGKDEKQEAIMDAHKASERTRGGSFSVFGCSEGYYSDDTLIYCTSGNRNSWKF